MAGATTAIQALDRAKVAYTLHEYAHDPAVRSYGDEAATALGTDPARVFKTLVVAFDGRFAVCVVPVGAQLDLKAAASALGVKKVAMADPADAERITGYIVGAISPIGQKKALPTLVDEGALAWERVCCSGGRRGLEIELAPADLVAVTKARTAPIARAR